MNEKAWIWTAMDGSDETRDGTPILEKFAVRFKEVETAKDFEKVFNENKPSKTVEEKKVFYQLTIYSLRTYLQEEPKTLAPPAAEKKKDSSKPSGKFSLGFGFEKKEESKIEETKVRFIVFQTILH